MTSDRKKPGVTFWATVLVAVVLVGYPLSIAPMLWLCRKLGYPDWMGDPLAAAWIPLQWAMLKGPKWFAVAMLKYFEWWP
jgi:hypothetical protein